MFKREWAQHWEKSRDGRTIGGAGRLTEQICDDFQLYYGNAIRNNRGDLQGMVKAVKAILHHSWSTDEAPDHKYCPVGESTWCKFQRANVLGQTPPAHNTNSPLLVTLSNQSLIAWVKSRFFVAACEEVPKIPKSPYMGPYGNGALKLKVLLPQLLRLQLAWQL